MVKRYVKRPIPVEAVKVERENKAELEGLLRSGSTEWEETDSGFWVHSWEGILPVAYGDGYWIIKEIKGECYPCDGKAFADSYDEFAPEEGE